MWKANNVRNVNRGFSFVYVYCDVLEHVLVGDSKTPLLRIIKVAGKGNYTIHARYEKPIYVPLQKKHFDSFERDIRTDTGKPIPFEYGKVIVTLYFRLRKVPYLVKRGNYFVSMPVALLVMIIILIRVAVVCRSSWVFACKEDMDLGTFRVDSSVDSSI